MSTMRLEKILFWITRFGAYALPFTFLIVTHSLFFPFVSGKNFAFRIIVELMAAAWAGLLLLNFKKYWPQWNMVSIAFALFVGVMTVSAFFGVDFAFSFWSNFERMEGLVTHLHLLLLFFILAGTFQTRREWFLFFGVSIAASILVAFLGLLEYTGEVTSVADSARIISTLGNPLYVAAYLTFTIFLAVFLWFQSRSAFLKWLLGGIVVFELLVFFLTGSRGAFLGMFVGAGIIFFLLTIRANAKKRILFLVTLVFLLSIPVALYSFRSTPFIQNHDILRRFSDITLESGRARLILWGMVFESFRERPILGWGIGNFTVPYTKYYDPRMFDQEPWFDRTHNMPLEWLVTTGILGFLSYLALFGSVVWALVRSVACATLDKKSTFIFVGMLAAYLVQIFFVFDTLSTYLMLTILFGFFFVTASVSGDTWSGKNTLMSPRAAMPYGAGKVKQFLQPRASFGRATGILAVFMVFVFLVFMINVKPIMANYSLSAAISLFNQQRFEEASDYFQKALHNARGTIGVSEIREHLTFSVYKLFSQKELLTTPTGEALYHFTANELERQVAENSQKHRKAKHDILLAQLYHQWALLKSDRDALDKSFAYYELALQTAPRYVSVYPVAANLYAQTGNTKEAIRLAEIAVSLLEEAGKYDPRIFYSRPLFYTSVQRYDDAYRALEDISANYSSAKDGRLDADMMENVILATRSHGQAAIPFLEKIYRLDKTLVSASLMLAQINATLGHIDQARLYAFRALEQDPSLQQQVYEFLKTLDEI